MPISAAQHQKVTQRFNIIDYELNKKVRSGLSTKIKIGAADFKITLLDDIEAIRNTPAEKKSIRCRRQGLQLRHMACLALILQNASLPMSANAAPLFANTTNNLQNDIHGQHLAPSRVIPHQGGNRPLPNKLPLHHLISNRPESLGLPIHRNKRDFTQQHARFGTLDPHATYVDIASSLPDIIEIHDDKVKAKIFTRLTGMDSNQLEHHGSAPVVFFIRREKIPTRTVRRPMSEAMAEQAEQKQSYLRDNCHIRTKTNAGDLIGDRLLVAAEYIRNPVRGLVENIEVRINPNYQPEPWEVTLEEMGNLGFDLVFGFFTGGAYPIIKYSTAQGLKVIGHALNGDEACVLSDFSPEEMASLLFNTDAGITNHGLDIEQPLQALPTELAISPPFVPDGIFYHEYIKTGLKQVQHAVFSHAGQEYRIIQKSANEFIAINTANIDDVGLHKNVYFNEKDNKIYFDSSFPEGQGSDYTLEPGAHFITIRGRHYPVFASGEFLEGITGFSVELIDKSGKTYMSPVYKEPLLNTWHLSVINDQPVFDTTQCDILSEICLPPSVDHHYKPTANLSPEHYGSGVLFEVSAKKDATGFALYDVVEMNGDVVPVRMTPIDKHGIRYEIYSLAHPEKPGYAIEWDGGRWRFERATTRSVSAELVDAVHPDMYTTQVVESELSAPDAMGIKWDKQDNAYLKINNQYVKLEKYSDTIFAITHGENVLFLKFEEGEFIPDLAINTAECLTNNLLPNRVLRHTPQLSILPYNKNCVAFTLSKISRNGVQKTLEILLKENYIKAPSELEHNSTVTRILNQLSMPNIIKDMPYQEVKNILKSRPAGRYFAVNSKTQPFDDNGPSHAFSILLNKKSIGIAGNNAELANTPYNSIIKDNDLISVWGPISDNTILTATDNHIIKTN